MADLYEQWIGKVEGQKGSFITNEEGRVVFIGGPGSGGGTGEGSVGGAGGGVTVLTRSRPNADTIANVKKAIADSKFPGSVSINKQKYAYGSINIKPRGTNRWNEEQTERAIKIARENNLYVRPFPSENYSYGQGLSYLMAVGTNG